MSSIKQRYAELCRELGHIEANLVKMRDLRERILKEIELLDATALQLKLYKPDNAQTQDKGD